MQGNNIKAPNPTKNQLLDLARTQSAPPEGKEGELGDLINKLPKNNNSNQQALNNAASSQTKEKKLNLKAQSFFTTSESTGTTPTTVTLPTTTAPVFQPTNIHSIEQTVSMNIAKFQENQAKFSASTAADTKSQEMRDKVKKKLNVSASVFTLSGNPPPPPVENASKNDWDIPIPKQTPPQTTTSANPKLKRQSVPTKNVSSKPVLNQPVPQEDEKIIGGLEKIPEETKEKEDHIKEMQEKELREKEIKEKEKKEIEEKEKIEKLEKERLEKELRDLKEKERIENERKEKEVKEKLEKERLEKEKLEKELKEKELKEKEMLEKQQQQNRNHENLGVSITQKTANTITKQYLINLIENGKKSNIPVPEYLKIICNREVIPESFSSRRPLPNKGGGRGGAKNEGDRVMSFGGGMKDRSSEIQPNNQEQHEKAFLRNSIDPRSLEIKSKINAWTSAMMNDKNDPMKLLEKNIRANLNILTPDNFNDIREKILDLARPNRECIDMLVQKIIEKAWVEPKYIETYAQLCNFLQNEKTLVFPDENKSKTTETGSKKKANTVFKSKLLEKIQKAFENEDVTKNTKDLTKMTPEELETFLKMKKNKILGNVKFIGELYLNRVIPQKVIHICSCSMFDKFQTEYFKAMAEKDTVSDDFEYNLEGIIKLYDRVAKLYDKEREKEMTSEEKELLELFKKQFYDLEKNKITKFDSIFNEHQEKLTTNGIFKLLEFVRDNIKLPTKKISNLIDNLVDRRNADWKDKLLSKEGPKTIKELHNEHVKEQEQIQKEIEIFKAESYEDNRYNRGYRGSRESGREMIYVEKKAANPVFQVHSDKNKIEEEKKEVPAYSSDKKVKLTFSMDRSKTATSSILSKDSKMSKAEIENSVKLIIKKLEEKRDEEKEGEYTEKHAFEDLLSLIPKANSSDIISRFLHDYYDGVPAEVEKRVLIPYKLVVEGGIKKEDFLKEFGLSLSRIWSNVSDFPHLLTSMAKIFFEFNKTDMLKYGDIEIDWTGGAEKVTEETTEEIQFVLKDFLESSYKLLKEKGVLQKKEEELKNFLTKINLGDVEATQWYDKMKKRIS